MDSFRSSSNNFRATPQMSAAFCTVRTASASSRHFIPVPARRCGPRNPYGRTTAVDLITGTESWMVANGAEMSPDLVPGAGGRKFRACNKATGAMLWETELPAGTTGAPLSYMFEGKQYIVVAVGSKEAGSAQFVARSLP